MIYITKKTFKLLNAQEGDILAISEKSAKELDAEAPSWREYLDEVTDVQNIKKLLGVGQ
jgi:hypothetical protein